METSVAQLADICRAIRIGTLRMINRSGASHVGSAFSMVELLVVLYWQALRIKPSDPEWNDRDRFILSKGHAVSALYAVLAARGFFPEEWLETFYQNGSRLAGHATRSGVPGIELSTGSLGHGLAVATGMALAGRRQGAPWRVFALLSDGECDEGSVWEAALFAPHHQLGNLVAIVDYNKIQSLGRVDQVMALEPFADKWRAFGWAVREVDGHDIDAVSRLFADLPFEPDRPNCVIAHTVKGKGVSFMEDDLLWHYRTPRGEEFDRALEELERGR